MDCDGERASAGVARGVNGRAGYWGGAAAEARAQGRMATHRHSRAVVAGGWRVADHLRALARSGVGYDIGRTDKYRRLGLIDCDGERASAGVTRSVGGGAGHWGSAGAKTRARGRIATDRHARTVVTG